MRCPIIITGASKRGGLALCKALLEQGYPIIAVYREAPGELAGLPGVEAYQADLAVAQSRQQLIAAIKERHDALRGIIHNASAWLDDSQENLALMLALHVEAPFDLNQELAPLLKRAGRADIIHICDDTAQRGTRNHIGYAASKAALFNLTLSFAEKLAPEVRVNSISPGLLMLKENSTADYRQKTLKKALLEFEPGNAPLVEAVTYLLGSSYSTGSNIVINGGRHLRAP